MKTSLHIIRGDSKAYKFQRKYFSGEVITDRPDSLYFTIKRNYNVKDFVLQKNIEHMSYDDEDECWHFTLEPSDTENLPYGHYVYDIQAVQNGFKTTISKGDVYIDTEVTFKENE